MHRLGAMLATVGSVVTGAARPTPAQEAAWTQYQIIEWQPRSPAQLVTLKRIGVTTGMVPSNHGADPAIVAAGAAPLLAAGMNCYIENIATDFYSPYHRFSPDRPVNWRFTEAQDAYDRDPGTPAPLVRAPSLSDPVWLRRVQDRLTALVHATPDDRVLFYNLGDETGIADLAAFWDFDFSPDSLSGFQTWLAAQYGSLEALNAEWGSHFPHWNAVRPETTREAMRRPNDDYAAWADFKAWMDVAFARAVEAGTAAVHRGDPTARAAIEGAQIPGWGGYDYSRLAQAVDVMEIYDIGENLPILRSLDPRLVPLTTVFGAAPAQLHAIWREWLRGSRGLILWDSKGEIVRPDGSLGPSGRAYAPIFAALRGALGRTLLASQPVFDPVAILYSPASFRIEWMIENRPHGDAWMHSSAEADGSGNATRETLADYAGTLAHLGIEPHYITSGQLARGDLAGAKVLILPHAVALSAEAIRAVRTCARAGVLVVADAEPGAFDEHGRRRAHLPLHDLFVTGEAVLLPGRDRPKLAQALVSAHVAAAFPVAADDVETYRYRSGGATILALQRDLAPTGAKEAVVVELPHPLDAVDLRAGRSIGRIRMLSLTLGPIAPAVIAFTEPGAAQR